mmetsp:Transcript_8309/g.14608  ORF Transcript_8309/g.14608 Transcript_8309/m.14608 type:complete len:83 (+) Transcript_8309:456-704(+)
MFKITSVVLAALYVASTTACPMIPNGDPVEFVGMSSLTIEGRVATGGCVPGGAGSALVETFNPDSHPAKQLYVPIFLSRLKT